MLVLSSGAVLRMVLEREDEPTGAAPPSPPASAPEVAAPASRVAVAAPGARLLVPALPRHRARSSVLLVVLVVVVGVLVAAAIGSVLALLAYALRSAVTS